MKSSLVKLMLPAALFITSSLSAQSVDEVIDKYYEAIGGKEAWRKINTMKLEASIDVQGNEIPVVIYQSNNKAMKSEVLFNGTVNYNIITTEGGWKYFPIMGQASPEPMTEDEMAANKDGLDIQGDMLDYQSKGHKAEYLGVDKVENNDVHKVKLTRKSGTEIIYLIDAKSYYITRAIAKVKVNGEEKEQTQILSNYQKVTGGISLPFVLEGAGPGVITVSKVEVNPVLNEGLFKVTQ